MATVVFHRGHCDLFSICVSGRCHIASVVKGGSSRFEGFVLNVSRRMLLRLRTVRLMSSRLLYDYCKIVICEVCCDTFNPFQPNICLPANRFVAPWRVMQRRTRIRSLKRPQSSRRLPSRRWTLAVLVPTTWRTIVFLLSRGTASEEVDARSTAVVC